MLEIVDGRTTDAVTGIVLAHPCAFGSGELKSWKKYPACLHARYFFKLFCRLLIYVFQNILSWIPSDS